jgi:hypothetical protein
LQQIYRGFIAALSGEYWAIGQAKSCSSNLVQGKPGDMVGLSPG